jgi:hypothetical protein
MGIKQAAQKISEITTRSVLNSLLWLPGTLIVVLGALGMRGNPNMTVVWGLLAILLLLVVAVIVYYGYFAVNAPDRLQSEQLLEKVLQMQVTQGKDGPVAIEAKAVTSNPRARQPKAINKEADQ